MTKIDQKQKGSALVLAMFITTAILTLVGLSTLSNDATNSIVKKNNMQFARDEIAKTLVSYITNPQIIKKQAGEENKNLTKGHSLLYNCLNGTDEGGVKCERTSNISSDSDGYYNLTQLMLLPPDDFQYPSKKLDRAPNDAQEKNCPSAGHPSCQLSGGPDGGDKVGYNLSGETGELSPCFPFEPVVYINPYCGKDEFGVELLECTRAEDLEFVYQLVHHKYQEACPLDHGKKPLNLGIFPKKPEVVSLPRHALVDYECNPGAFIKGYESDGGVLCECRFPFTPVPGQSNEKGVLCQDAVQQCPGGTVLVSRDQDGKPVCRHLNELSDADIRPPMYAATETFNGGLANRSIECSNKGWLQNVEMQCEGQATTREDPGEGHSCLFFYEFVKMIDNGGTMIPGAIPVTFYRNDASLPCNAHKESFTMRPPTTGYDWACQAAIFGLILAGAAGTGAILKKATSKVISKATAKVIGKAAAKTAAKKATTKTLTKWAAKKGAQRAAQIAATDAAEKAAKEAAQEAVERLGKEATAEAVEKAAKEAAEKAAAQAANEVMEKFIREAAQEAGQEASERLAEQGLSEAQQKVTKKLTTEVTQKGIEEAVEKEAAEALGREFTKKAVKTQAQEAAERVIRRSTTAKATKDSAKTALKKSAIAAGAYSGGFSGLLLGDLSPSLFTQALALGFAIDGAAVFVNVIKSLPFPGARLAAAGIAFGFGVLYASWQVKVDYNCYPLETEPQIKCTLIGTCYKYGQEFSK